MRNKACLWKPFGSERVEPISYNGLFFIHSFKHDVNVTEWEEKICVVREHDWIYYLWSMM